MVLSGDALLEFRFIQVRRAGHTRRVAVHRRAVETHRAARSLRSRVADHCGGVAVGSRPARSGGSGASGIDDRRAQQSG